MLRELRIRDFAIIEDLAIGFRPGLNVITGETGAGKSIILQALALLCGGRSAAEVVRTDAEAASIEGLFDGAPGPELLDALGVSPDDDLLVRRVVPRVGKGRVYVNGSPATVGLLEQLGESLVHIYGQHEQAQLLRPSTHLVLLDEFGGLLELRERMASSYAAWAGAERRLRSLAENRRAAAERRSSLEADAEELVRAAVRAGDEEELRREREVLRHAERLGEVTRGGEAHLYSREGAVVAGLARLGAQLAELARIDPALGSAGELVESARVQLEEAALQLGSYAERVQFDPERQEEIESRLALLSRLGRKHGVPATELPQRLENLRAELGSLSGEASEIESLGAAVEELRGRALAVAGELSAARREVARRLERRMREELARLGLDGAVFRVAWQPPAAGEPAGALGADGVDRVEFLLSANAGEDAKALARVASGGELSRVMLALKALTATRLEKPILIFDEVDAGIGGIVADAVARRLKSLAGTRQLLCITHLPQIAAYADHHLAVEKRRQRGRTTSRARELTGDERVRELSRMLGGDVAPAEAESYARRLVAEARGAGPVS